MHNVVICFDKTLCSVWSVQTLTTLFGHHLALGWSGGSGHLGSQGDSKARFYNELMLGGGKPKKTGTQFVFVNSPNPLFQLFYLILTQKDFPIVFNPYRAIQTPLAQWDLRPK